MGATELEPDADDQRLRAGLEELSRTGLVRPVSSNPTEIRFFGDCELSSVVENQLFESVDPRAFSEASRARYASLAGRPRLGLTSPLENAWCSSAFFLLENAEPAGTIALANRYLGSSLVDVSSLYVLPEYRRRGIAGRTLARARETLAKYGAAGLSVPTCWAWQRAVRFYLGLGMWVESWRDALEFAWRDTRFTWSAEVAENHARFCVLQRGAEQFSIIAHRCGDRLDLRPMPTASRLAEDALQTFAVVLAVNAWPLIRSDQAWAERRASRDRGAPEGLAYKVELFEAVERRAGLAVRTPRIPGIAYRDFDALD